MFKINVGMLDRIIRVIVGLGVLSLFYFYPQSEWRYVALVGLIPLITGLFGICPVYTLFGWSTCTVRRA